MIKAGESRRNFFKKAAVAAGLVGAAAWLGKFISTRADSIGEINGKNANDLARQKKAWLQKQFVAMTDNEKQQMLDDILNVHNKDHA